MTNAELISKIREEIERLIEESDFDESANLYSLLSFLSTLEEQPKEVSNPIFDECVANVDPEVMEEVRENELVRFYLKDLCGSEKDEISEATLHNNFPIMWDDLRDIARHFAEWGTEHLKK